MRVVAVLALVGAAALASAEPFLPAYMRDYADPLADVERLQDGGPIPVGGHAWVDITRFDSWPDMTHVTANVTLSAPPRVSYAEMNGWQVVATYTFTYNLFLNTDFDIQWDETLTVSADSRGWKVDATSTEGDYHEATVQVTGNVVSIRIPREAFSEKCAFDINAAAYEQVQHGSAVEDYGDSQQQSRYPDFAPNDPRCGDDPPDFDPELGDVTG